MIIALEYIHANRILHRDIKPENLVFDEKGNAYYFLTPGYLRVTDFGISRQFNPENSKDTSGTPGYMAPEVMCRNNHSYESDYYALGDSQFFY